MANDKNIPQVSEIEIIYNPVIKPSEMVKISCSKDAEKIADLFADYSKWRTY